MISHPSLSDAGKQLVDFFIGAVGVAFFLKLLPVVTGVLAFVLIVLRIVVGLQERYINRLTIRRLERDAVQPPLNSAFELANEVANEAEAEFDALLRKIK